MANSPEQNTSDAPRPRGPDSFHCVEWDRERADALEGRNCVKGSVCHWIETALFAPKQL
jgi:hypothetical protein